jgi:hypothetical protein
MTNLERLEKDIREKLPRLMELTEGCFINYKHSNAKLINKRGSEYCLLKASGIVEWVQDYVIINYRIIGHDPILSDVLEWLSIKDNNTNVELYEDGLDIDGNALWCLEIPFLKDQPQELIEYLATLI